MLLAPVVRAGLPRMALNPVNIGQLYSPVSLTTAHDGTNRIFICEQQGKIMILQGGGVYQDAFLDLTAKVVPLGTDPDERGLLGLAFHPGYANSASPGFGKFYVFYSAPSPNAPGTPSSPVNCRTTLSEFTVSADDPNLADPNSERILLAFDHPQANHLGGQLAFGPDGYLYIGTGDGGSSDDNDAGHTGGSALRPTDALGNAQDRRVLLGKILRIDPLGTDGPGGQYGVPADNPFIGQMQDFADDLLDGPMRPEIYAYGLRNPWRFSFDQRAGGTNRMFCGDVGQERVEEVNLVVSGGNYGWRYLEGAEMPAFSSGAAVNPMANPGGPFIAPIAMYAHPGAVVGSPALPELGVSVIGGYVYRGAAIPGLQGRYIFGDYGPTGGRMMALEETAPGSGSFVLTSSIPLLGGNPLAGQRILTLGEDDTGELYVAVKSTAGVLETAPNGQPAGGIYQVVPQQRVTSSLTASRDNTIFSEDIPLNRNYSDGQGSLYIGRTGNNFGPYVRRALVGFEVSSLVTPGSVIRSAVLNLHLSKAAAFALGTTIEVHRLTEGWGEGTSLNTLGGYGASATPDDATWNFGRFNTQAWTTPGGTFETEASASATLSASGFLTWNSTASLVADVQRWLDVPAENNGWLFIGNESTNQTACQFDSRSQGSGPPTLILDYDTGGAFASIRTPGDITAEATSSSGVAVTFEPSAVDYGGAPTSVAASPASGATFPLGVSTVTLSTTDVLGSLVSNTFTVTVRDSTPPSLTVPSALLVEATGPTGAVATFQITTQDAVSTPTLQVTPGSGSVFPLGATTVDVRSTDAAGNLATGSFVVTVQDTTAPVIQNTPRDRTTSAETLSDFRSEVQATDAVGIAETTQSPAPGSALALGPTEVTITVKDAAGNSASTSFNLIRNPAVPDHRVVLATKSGVPGAGDPGGPPSGAVLRSFGVPAINDAGELAFTAKWTSPSGSGAGVFVGTAPALLAKAGDPAVGAEPATYAAFSDPMIDSDGHVAFLATLKTRTNPTVLVSNVGGALRVLARPGTPIALPGNPVLGRLREFSLVDGEILVTAQLRGGTPAITRNNDEAAIRFPAGGGTPEWMVREGDPLAGSTVKAFRLLQVVAGSPGQNRGHVLNTASFFALLADRRQALAASTNGTLTEIGVTGDIVGGTLPAEAKFATFGPIAADGVRAAFALNLATGQGGIVKNESHGILLTDGSGPRLLAQEGKAAADLSSVNFRTFADPVLALGEGDIAFAATLRGTGAKASNDTALFHRPPQGTLRCIAREGDPAAGTPAGVKWAKFVSLAAPGGSTGALFQATLSGTGVRATNNSGLWALDSAGTVRLLFRTGTPLTGGKTLQRFTILSAVPGSTGASRSFNRFSQIVWRADFTDGTSGIVTTSIP